MNFDDFAEPTNGNGVNGGDAGWRSVPSGRGRDRGGRRGNPDRGRNSKKDDRGPSLQHVPCKFFMQGRCTAGNSCPFSHEHPENTAVCKYFLAGTCKYGSGCALAHIAPNGTLLKTKATRNIRNANIRERAEREREQLDQQDLQELVFNGSDPMGLGPSRRSGSMAASPPLDQPFGSPAGFPGRHGGVARSDPMDLRQPRRGLGAGVFNEDDHGGSPASLLPSSLSELLTPMEQMQLSRSQEDSYLRSRGAFLGQDNPVSLLQSSNGPRRLAGYPARLSQSYAPGRIVDEQLRLYGRSIPEDIVSSPSTRLPYSPSDMPGAYLKPELVRVAREGSDGPLFGGQGPVRSELPTRSLLSSAFEGSHGLDEDSGRPFQAPKSSGLSSTTSPSPTGRGRVSPGEPNGSFMPAVEEIDVFRMDSLDPDLDTEEQIRQTLPPILASPTRDANKPPPPVLSFSAAARKALGGATPAEQHQSPAMAEAAKGTRSVAVDPRKNTPLCPFAVAGTCKMGDRCRYIHGIVCPSCHRAVLHPADSAAEHQAHIFECEKTVGANEDAKAKLEASKSLECGICFTEVMSRKDPRFGLLRCEHAFCIECIRGWRSTHAQDERLSCPSCRVPTPFITPSTIWLTGPEKEAAIEKYKQALGRIECKWWNYGRGTCPFGTSCFYAHTDRAGNVVKMELRSAQTSEGTGVVLNAPKLSDFLFPE